MSINNIADLTRELSDAADELKSGAMRIDAACALAKISHGVINSVRLEIDYARARGETPDIAFMSSKKSR